MYLFVGDFFCDLGIFLNQIFSKVHSEETEAKDYGLGGKTTKFTQGGVCHFE